MASTSSVRVCCVSMRALTLSGSACMRAESVDSMVAPTRSNRSSISSTEHVAGSGESTGQNRQKLSHGVFYLM